MQIIEIEKGSDAGRHLAELMADDTVYRIRLSLDGGVGTVKIKANEWMWSAPLRTTGRPRSVDIREPHSPLSTQKLTYTRGHGDGDNDGLTFTRV